MNYLEIASGTPVNRGIMIEANNLGNYICNEPLYSSVYLYDESAIEYVKENNTLKNFFGIRYIDKIPKDIDKGAYSD